MPLFLVAACSPAEQAAGEAAETPPASVSPPSGAASPSGGADADGFLYGRVTASDGAVFEGRLRWGGHEEALWNSQFNGVKHENPWVGYVPPERTSRSFFGIEFGGRERPVDGIRPFVARFGDIVRIDALGDEIRVTLKSGSEYYLDRYSADDLADGLRIWDVGHGVVDLNERQISSVEFFPTPQLGAAPGPLYGTVRSRVDEFTGVIQWDRELGLDDDELVGLSTEGERSVRMDAVRSIARRSEDSSLVTLRDGQEILLSGTRRVGRDNRGVYVDDPRYGRVLVPWQSFDRIDFAAGGTAPAYDDFPAGGRISGTVTTRSGATHTGRLIYDLDESEVTETLDAPAQGVDYMIPFGLIGSIALPVAASGGAPGARVTLHSGEELVLEASGDLAEGHVGMLIFPDDADRFVHVPWSDVARIDLDRPPAMYPSGSSR